MEIFTWADPKYFIFARGLINSLRYNQNLHLIHFCLLDFDDSQFETVKNIFKNDSKINFIREFSDKQKKYEVIDNKSQNPDVFNGKIQFYRNFRPRMVKKILSNSKDGKLCTICANGLVFDNLDYIEKYLDNNDFVFLEREKKNVFTDQPSSVNCIEDIYELVKNHNINIDDILDQTTGKVVLLGLHAMSNTENSHKVLDRWIDLIENTESINLKFSDMNLFVKAYVEEMMTGNISLTKETAKDIDRRINPICDTSLIPGSKVWFAKGPQKFTSKIYHDKIQNFINYKYQI